MEKPISIVLNDLKQNLADTINEANLPLCLVESIVKDLYEEISILSKQQLKKDKEEYEKSLKEEKKDDN